MLEQDMTRIADSLDRILKTMESILGALSTQAGDSLDGEAPIPSNKKKGPGRPKKEQAPDEGTPTIPSPALVTQPVVEAPLPPAPISDDQIREALKEFMAKHNATGEGYTKGVALLGKFGAVQVKMVPQDRRAEFLKECGK